MTVYDALRELEVVDARIEDLGRRVGDGEPIERSELEDEILTPFRRNLARLIHLLETEDHGTHRLQREQRGPG